MASRMKCSWQGSGSGGAVQWLSKVVSPVLLHSLKEAFQRLTLQCTLQILSEPQQRDISAVLMVVCKAISCISRGATRHGYLFSARLLCFEYTVLSLISTFLNVHASLKLDCSSLAIVITIQIFRSGLNIASSCRTALLPTTVRHSLDRVRLYLAFRCAFGTALTLASDYSTRVTLSAGP